ncbi:MAG TPA: hypothetical protein VEA38_15205 [Terriglobales bacterium]|nr:hypothetical protein [Terriglobales bacterium]
MASPAAPGEATPRPWRVVRERLKLSPLGLERGLRAEPPPELIGIETVWDHGQLKGPVPVVTTAHGPYYEPNHHIYIRPADAELIVRAVNAHEALVSALREVLPRYVELFEAAGLGNADDSVVVPMMRAALALAEGETSRSDAR